MRISTLGRCLLAIGLLAATALPATAATYKMPIKLANMANIEILKVFVDGGTAKRVTRTNNDYLYEVTMKDERCETTIHITTEWKGSSGGLAYNVCAEKGLFIQQRW
jgi:hypothetical protein